MEAIFLISAIVICVVLIRNALRAPESSTHADPPQAIDDDFWSNVPEVIPPVEQPVEPEPDEQPPTKPTPVSRAHIASITDANGTLTITAPGAAQVVVLVTLTKASRTAKSIRDSKAKSKQVLDLIDGQATGRISGKTKPAYVRAIAIGPKGGLSYPKTHVIT